MYFVGGMTHQRIAGRLGVSKQAVTKQICSAIEKLKKSSEGGCQTPSPACVKWED
jgi:DNA-directed RNA polymerase specialized sigma subunit